MVKNSIKISLIQEAAKAWHWLRNQDEYRKDYLLWVGLVKTKKITPFQISLTLEETLKIRNDVIAKQKFDKQQEYFRKWGFYPLLEPSLDLNQESNRELWYRAFLMNFEGSYAPALNDHAVVPLNTNLLSVPPVRINKNEIKNRREQEADYKIKKISEHSFDKYDYIFMKKWGERSMPEKVIFEIDYRKSKQQIFSELESYLQACREMTNFRESRSRFDNLHLIYKASVLKNLGYSEAEIKKMINVHPPTSPSHDAYRKLAERVLKIIRKN